MRYTHICTYVCEISIARPTNAMKKFKHHCVYVCKRLREREREREKERKREGEVVGTTCVCGLYSWT